MGGGGGGGMFSGTKGNSVTSFSDNLPNLTSKYPLTSTGYFGVKGQSGDSSIRNICSSNPRHDAKTFYSVASKGGQESPLPNGKGVMSKMSGGTRIVYRPISSSDGSPAVEITIIGPGNAKTQKIHFVKG